jgi:hypothetical protein
MSGSIGSRFNDEEEGLDEDEDEDEGLNEDEDDKALEDNPNKGSSSDDIRRTRGRLKVGVTSEALLGVEAPLCSASSKASFTHVFTT